MLETQLDHLVVAAPSLATGTEWVREILGVAPEPGGEHPRMGTHNALLRLGDATYLEVIAVNPEAAPPSRPRWFELDRLGPGDPPRLAAWVARTNDIHGAALESPIDWGTVEPMSRGTLSWLITLGEGGRLPADGVAPLLIHWETHAHPAADLPDRHCSLVSLQGFHMQAESIRKRLARVGFRGLFTISDADAPALIGHIRTPTGVRRLESAPGAAGKR